MARSNVGGEAHASAWPREAQDTPLRVVGPCLCVPRGPFGRAANGSLGVGVVLTLRSAVWSLGAVSVPAIALMAPCAGKFRSPGLRADHPELICRRKRVGAFKVPRFSSISSSLLPNTVESQCGQSDDRHRRASGLARPQPPQETWPTPDVGREARCCAPRRPMASALASPLGCR